MHLPLQLTATCVLTALSAITVACGDDDAPASIDADDLVGTWTLESLDSDITETYVYTFGTLQDRLLSETLTSSATVSFETDGSFSFDGTLVSARGGYSGAIYRPGTVAPLRLNFSDASGQYTIDRDSLTLSAVDWGIPFDEDFPAAVPYNRCAITDFVPGQRLGFTIEIDTTFDVVSGRSRRVTQYRSEHHFLLTR